MKLVMDEKLKHRLIGLAVIISLGAIFAPAVMRKSSQNVENFSVNVKLPPKPSVPNVAVTDEKDMFKTIKVTRVEIPPVTQEQQVNELAKAEPIDAEQLNKDSDIELAQNETSDRMEPIKLALNEAATGTAKKVILVAENQQVKRASTVIAKQTVAKPKAKVIAKVVKPKPVQVAKASKVIPRPFVKKDVYAVQLASFSQLSNAQALVSKLKSRGYKANYIKTNSRSGAVYKVYAGHSPDKNQAVKFKTQLASALQLNGFIVNTGVS